MSVDQKTKADWFAMFKLKVQQIREDCNELKQHWESTGGAAYPSQEDMEGLEAKIKELEDLIKDSEPSPEELAEYDRVGKEIDEEISRAAAEKAEDEAINKKIDEDLEKYEIHSLGSRIEPSADDESDTFWAVCSNPDCDNTKPTNALVCSKCGADTTPAL